MREYRQRRGAWTSDDGRTLHGGDGTTRIVEGPEFCFAGGHTTAALAPDDERRVVPNTVHLASGRGCLLSRHTYHKAPPLPPRAPPFPPLPLPPPSLVCVKHLAATNVSSCKPVNHQSDRSYTHTSPRAAVLLYLGEAPL